MNKSSKQIVAVGMSGGLDSTMAAFLLKEQGYTVIGLTMKIWDGPVRCEATRSGCYGPNEASDIADAKQAADRLGIEHHIVDLCKEYKQTVIQYFSNEYTHGKTPNPCVMCNSQIKFGSLLENSLSSGIKFDFFATGHYARVAYNHTTDEYMLKCGVDNAKDQSYFLHRLNQEQLQKIMFPLGDYYKEDIKTMARKTGFGKYTEKPESQDFLEWNDYGTLLQNRGQQGNIRDAAGNVIGTHQGIAFYTIGQRKMLNLSGMKEPYYVVGIDAQNNEIIAGPKKHLLNNILSATDLHWIIPCEKYISAPLNAKIRSAAVPAACDIFPEPGNTAMIRFVVPQESVTPGQSVVFYAGDIVLGGGTIEAIPQKQNP